MVSICADSIDTPSLEELDGIVFAFITRRNTIMPFAQRLTPSRACWPTCGASRPTPSPPCPAKAGESVRIVGMDDFIIGAQGRKVNAFHDIVMDLVARYPGKVHFFQYNTGGMGEIIEIDKATGKKKLVRKAERVPIDLMAALQRGDLRGTNEYPKGRLGTEYVVKCEGADLSAYDAENFYSEEQIEAYVADLVDGRRKFTEEIAEQGLRKDIRDARPPRARRHRGEGPPQGRAVGPRRDAPQTAAEDRDPRSRFISPWEPRRPSASLFPQPAGRSDGEPPGRASASGERPLENYRRCDPPRDPATARSYIRVQRPHAGAQERGCVAALAPRRDPRCAPDDTPSEATFVHQRDLPRRHRRNDARSDSALSWSRSPADVVCRTPSWRWLVAAIGFTAARAAAYGLRNRASPAGR